MVFASKCVKSPGFLFIAVRFLFIMNLQDLVLLCFLAVVCALTRNIFHFLKCISGASCPLVEAAAHCPQLSVSAADFPEAGLSQPLPHARDRELGAPRRMDV